MELNLELLKILQEKFPIESRPFLKIGEIVGLEEDEVIKEVSELQDKGIIRQISAIFHPEFFGHRTGLFAFRVEDALLDDAIKKINSHPGVTHNYLRAHYYNIWFILATTPDVILEEEGKRLAEACGVKDYLYLPAKRIFKISTKFDLTGGTAAEEALQLETQKKRYSFSKKDELLVKLLQEPLPILQKPFLELAKRSGIPEEEIFEWLVEMKKLRALRRFGALLKHDKIGFKYNLMVAWEVSPERIEEIAESLCKYSFVSHCYERKTYPHWRYNLYSMCHFREKDESRVIFEIAEDLGINKFICLPTIKELKKARLKLFYELNKN